MVEWEEITPPAAVGEVYETRPYDHCDNCDEFQVTTVEQRVAADSHHANQPRTWTEWFKLWITQSLNPFYTHDPAGDDYTVINDGRYCKNCQKSYDRNV